MPVALTIEQRTARDLAVLRDGLAYDLDHAHGDAAFADACRAKLARVDEVLARLAHGEHLADVAPVGWLDTWHAVPAQSAPRSRQRPATGARVVTVRSVRTRRRATAAPDMEIPPSDSDLRNVRD